MLMMKKKMMVMMVIWWCGEGDSDGSDDGVGDDADVAAAEVREGEGWADNEDEE